MGEGMCRLCREKETELGLPDPKKESHGPDKSVLWKWKNFVREVRDERQQKDGKTVKDGGRSPREMRASSPVGTKKPTRFVCHVR